MKKGKWEQDMIERARTNSKILWNFAKDITGKTKKKDESTYIYIEGEKKSTRNSVKFFMVH